MIGSQIDAVPDASGEDGDAQSVCRSRMWGPLGVDASDPVPDFCSVLVLDGSTSGLENPGPGVQSIIDCSPEKRDEGFVPVLADLNTLQKGRRVQVGPS